MTFALLYDNKRTSAACQRKLRTALTLNYLYGLNSFKLPYSKDALKVFYSCSKNKVKFVDFSCTIDILAIQQKSLDRALILYIFIPEIRSSGVRAVIIIVHVRKFYKM